MALSIRSAADFIASMVEYITGYNTSTGNNIDTRVGTVFKDVVIDAPSQGLETAYDDIVYSSKLSSLNYASEMTEDDLDAIGANYGLTRNTATAAYGSITFITTATKESLNANGILDTAIPPINAGTTVRLPASTTHPEIQYQTTQTAVISNTADWYKTHEYLHSDGAVHYSVDATIQAVTLGSGGNTGYGTITELASTATGILAVKNLASTMGGTDIETNDDFANRIKQKLAGNNIGTEAGIKSLLFSDARVKDAIILKPGDPDLYRNQYGGSIDIYVLGSDIQTYVNRIYFDGLSLTVPLTRLPVSSVNGTIVGTLQGATHNFLQYEPNTAVPQDWVYNKDNTALKDSTKETTTITFLETGDVPDAGTYIDVTLQFDKLIEDLQLMFDSAENHLVGSDILVRQAYENQVEMTMNITIFSGYSPTDVKNTVLSAIVTFVNALSLGQSLNPSDIIGIAENTAGVDAVQLSELAPVSTHISVIPDSITSHKYEYIRVEVNNIHITVNGRPV